MTQIVPGADLTMVPRPLVLVDGALSDTDLRWIDRHLALCGTRAIRSGSEGEDIARVDVSWISTVMIR